MRLAEYWSRYLIASLILTYSHISYATLCNHVLAKIGVNAFESNFLAPYEHTNLVTLLNASCGHFCVVHAAAIIEAFASNKVDISKSSTALDDVVRTFNRPLNIADGADPIRVALSSVRQEKQSDRIGIGKTLFKAPDNSNAHKDIQIVDKIEVDDLRHEDASISVLHALPIDAKGRPLEEHALIVIPGDDGNVWLLDPFLPNDLISTVSENVKITLNGRTVNTIKLTVGKPMSQLLGRQSPGENWHYSMGNSEIHHFYVSTQIPIDLKEKP